MKKENLEKVTWAIMVVTALAEAVCGKKFMKRIRKRLNVLDKMAEVEVWVGVFNQICPDKKLSTGNTAFAHSQVVREEISHIIEKLESCDLPDAFTMEERMNKIMMNKIKILKQVAKRQ